MKTLEEVRNELSKKGITLTAWAREHGFALSTVHRTIRGEGKGRYGKSHKIAVLLGIKDGEIQKG
jgi:gp16 family phage-associated protein